MHESIEFVSKVQLLGIHVNISTDMYDYDRHIADTVRHY